MRSRLLSERILESILDMKSPFPSQVAASLAGAASCKEQILSWRSEQRARLSTAENLSRHRDMAIDFGPISDDQDDEDK